MTATIVMIAAREYPNAYGSMKPWLEMRIKVELTASMKMAGKKAMSHVQRG